LANQNRAAQFTDFPSPFCYRHFMARAPSLGAVILAAGESSRMGGDKALLPWPPSSAGATPGGQTFLSAAIHTLGWLNDFVVVVAGKNEGSLASVVYANGAVLVRNPEPERGQFSSLQVGLHEVMSRGRDAAMITLVDRPPVSVATVEQLRALFSEATERGKWAVVPEYGGHHGHPVVAGRELIEAYLRAPATANARDIQHQNQDHIEYVRVDDPFVAMNVDTPQDYANLSSSQVSA
jgi:molybdenum cofactor cytidylyltransferase